MEPHVYVIHLKHRTDRKKQFMEAWVAAALPTQNLHWHSAVLGSALPPRVLGAFPSRLTRTAKTRKARAGRVGCYLSHVAAIKNAIRRNHFPLLVLEDDAVPTGSVVALTQLFATAPTEATLLYFGALPVKDRKRVKGYCLTQQGQGQWFSPGHEQLYGGHAYGFATREAAEEMVGFLEANRMTFDSALVRWTKTHKDRVAVYCPLQFVQSDGFSDIEGMARHHER